MVKIGNKPIFINIIEIYAKYGVDNFHLALGYKHDEFIKFFLKIFCFYNSLTQRKKLSFI